jgi:hypothetical protein
MPNAEELRKKAQALRAEADRLDEEAKKAEEGGEALARLALMFTPLGLVLLALEAKGNEAGK